MTLILVALGALLVGVGVTASVARYFFRMGWEMAHDDRRLEPGAVVGQLPAKTPPAPSGAETTGPIRPVGEASGRHHKPQASDGPAPDSDPVWPVGDGDPVLERWDEVKA